MPEVQIVSFDIPFPPDYGGVIDVYYKIRYLHENGIEVVLHAFDYKEKKDWGDLPSLCKKIYTYKRKKGILYFLHYLPYTVVTRWNKSLNENLVRHGSPLIFEVLHTTGPLLDPKVRKLKTIYRHSNIEHRYYRGLAADEKNIFKKIYFFSEAIKFYFYEHILHHVHGIAAVNRTDAEYFSAKFHIPVRYIPSFHPYEAPASQMGKGDYVLFHGNLEVNENLSVAFHIMEQLVPALPAIRFRIAGKNPSKEFLNKAKQHQNLEVIPNPSEEAMQALIRDAHIHLIFTNNPEGLKLKFIFSCFSGRFIIASRALLNGHDPDSWNSAGVYASDGPSGEEIQNKIVALMNTTFEPDIIPHRTVVTREWNNRENLKKLIEMVFS